MEEIFRNAKKLKDFMSKQGVAFNKRLGQNFLINEEVLKRIVSVADVEGYGILEVGAGLGNLTELLQIGAKKVVAVELDLGLFRILQKRFVNCEDVVLVNGDVLKINLQQLLEREFYGLPVKICANLPYYITSSFVAGVLEQKLNVESLTLMVQKEAALRLCAKPGSKNCGAISYLVQYYSQPKILFEVSRYNFCPTPKVASCVVNIEIKNERKHLQDCYESKFFEFIRVAFSQRRKVLVSPLASRYKIDKAMLKAVLKNLGLNENARAQELSLDQFVQFFNDVFRIN